MSESKSWFAQYEDAATTLNRAEKAAYEVLDKRPVCNTPDCISTRAKANAMGYIGRFMGPKVYDMYYNTFGIMFYISLTIFIVFLMLTFVHFTMFPVFSFSPNDSGFIPIPTTVDRQITFLTAPARSDTAGTFVSLSDSDYTLGMDVYLTGNFMVSNIPRVILYRASTNVTQPVAVVGESDLNQALLTTYPKTNILVWLDPIKNDLYVSTVTQVGGSKTLETTNAVENIPIKNVFRLAVVFANNFVEIYINGKLEQSMPILHPIVVLPSTESDKTKLYPTINSIQQNVMIGNLTMWPRVLTAREIQAHETNPIKTNTFFM